VEIQEQVPLAPLTTFQVGGAARYFVQARSTDNIRAAVDFARARDLPLFVLGGGSNLVVSDRGFPGVVLKIAIEGIDERRENGKAVFAVGAGVDWDAFVAHAITRNCAGIECLSGIPGTVGATPVQNVGAYGQEVSETIITVQALDLARNEICELCPQACGFEYRSTIFNTTARGRYIILQVTFALAAGGAPRIMYADLKNYFAGRNAPTLAETRDAVRQVRRSKAMLIVEGDEDCHSAGSFFKNPVVSQQQYSGLAERLTSLGLVVPTYPAPDGMVKLPAAWLVEHAGFHKGLTRGPVGISRKHALAIVNRGGATAEEIVRLKNEIQQGVADQFGIQLQPEPVFVGFGGNV
jgi:UDP-N-acetylmuramate dehydrogenase